MYCQYCGKEESMPFRCPFCGAYFCAEHRLPEQHKCAEAWRTTLQREEPTSVVAYPSAIMPKHVWTTGSSKRRLGFSTREVLHILIGVALVSAVGLSIPFGSIRTYSPVAALLAVAIFTVGFVLHELSHKFVAQLHGLWAEFRLSRVGVIITAISIVAPVKFIAPGMVMIEGAATLSTVGKLALAGPAANLLVGVVAILAFLPSTEVMVRYLFAFGCWVNSYMAMFNLIPFGQFDGLKVFRWSKVAWIGTLMTSILLLSLSSYYVFQ
ncbi:MAG: AN1-type zinc finger domain-containing protein [archaeon]